MSVELEPAPRDDSSPELESSDGTDSPLDADMVFALLKNSRRRLTLRFLKEHGGLLALGELAEHIAAHENDTSVAGITSKQRKRVYVSLYQCHLPMMDDAGVVDFNRPRGIIERRERAAQVERYLGTVDADEDDQSEESGEYWQTYLSLALVGGSVYGAQSVVLGPGDVTSVLTVAGLVASVVAVAVIQRHQWQEDTLGEFAA